MSSLSHSTEQTIVMSHGAYLKTLNMPSAGNTSDLTIDSQDFLFSVIDASTPPVVLGQKGSGFLKE
jgi:hypothetical protein